MELEIDRYRALLTPFVGDNPVGDINNQKAEALYDKLNIELSNADGLTPKPVDWLLIEELCVDILANHGKDLRVCGYLVEALRRLYGLEGLIEGIDLLNQWLECDYNQLLYPKRRESRQVKAWVACVKWSYDRFESTILDTQINESNFPQLVRLADAFILLDGILHSRFKDKTFATHKVLDYLKQIRRQAKAEIEKQQLAEQKKAEEHKAIKAKSALKSMGDGLKKMVGIDVQDQPDVKEPEDSSDDLVDGDDIVDGIANESDNQAPAPIDANPIPIAALEPTKSESNTLNAGNIDKYLNDASRDIKKVSTFIHQNDIHNPQSYYLARIAMWMTLDTLPANNILPRQPNQQQFEQLQTSFNAGEYQGVVVEAEKQFTAGALFNLDLQFLLVQSLDKLGATKASEIVSLMVAQLVNRFAGIVDMTFQNNEAVADAQTKGWLKGLVAKEVGSGSSDQANIEPDNTAEQNEPWSQTYERLKMQVGEDNDAQNLSVFIKGVQDANGLREQCYWQLAMAQYCIAAKHFDLAIAQLEDLLQKVDKATIAIWEPKLRVDIIAKLLQCHEQDMAHKGFNDVQKREFRVELKPLSDELRVLSPASILSLNL